MSNGYRWSPRNDDPVPKTSSTSVFWWVCTEGHEWQESADQMTLLGRCLICSGVRLRSGVNDLSVTHPEVAVLWDAAKNRMPVTQVTKANSDPAHWVLACGHPLKISPAQMVRTFEGEDHAESTLCRKCRQ